MPRYTVHFQGHVQGVGFRYTTANLAKKYDVAGYVQNLPDGRVCLVAEAADEATLQSLLEEVRHAMGRHIDADQVEKGPSTGEYGSPATPDTFGVRY